VLFGHATAATARDAAARQSDGCFLHGANINKNRGGVISSKFAPLIGVSAINGRPRHRELKACHNNLF